MRDFILTFSSEIDAIELLPDYRANDDSGWIGPIIPNCTRWIARPQYDEDGDVITPPETVSGWHCIIRAESLPESALSFVITEATDIEPLPAGGLLKPVVPQSVTSFQARAALHISGWLDRVETLMSDPNTDPVARIAWEYAQELQRQSPTVAAFADALGLTDWQVDELFIQAASIQA